MDKILKTILKRQMLKYPMMTAAKIQKKHGGVAGGLLANHTACAADRPEDAQQCCRYEVSSYRENEV
jgi:hypothetical protein